MKSFFGKSSAITIKSSSREDPHIFFQCIKKKKTGTWQKPSKGEGKIIKCSLEELIMILQVLRKHSTSWSSFHSFNGTKTSISFAWDKNGNETLWININKYSKSLSFLQVEIFKLLLEHLLEEKIEYATTPNYKRKQKSPSQDDNKDDRLDDTSKIISEEDSIEDLSTNHESGDLDLGINENFQVNARILRETNKALFLKFNSGIEI